MTTTTTQTPGAPALAPAQPTAPRSIPGLVKAIVSEKKPRSRAKKSKPSVSGLGEDVAAAVEADGVKTSATAPSDLSPALIASVEELEEVEEKKTSAVEAVQKRLRSANKKIVSPTSLPFPIYLPLFLSLRASFFLQSACLWGC